MLYFLFDLFSQLFLGFFDGGLLAGIFFLAAALYSFLFRSKKNLLNRNDFIEDCIVILIMTMILLRLLLVIKVYLFDSQGWTLIFDLPDSLILDAFYGR